MSYQASYLVDVGALALSEEADKNSAWVHALPIGSYKHPVYGTIDITPDRVSKFADSVKKKVRGVEPSINTEHDNSNGAAGWVKDADSRSDGLWLFVEWVKDAAQAIKEKKWRYFSAEFTDEWEDSQGNKFTDVIIGGALTNRPFMKNLVPVNLSEGTIDTAIDLVSIISGQTRDSLKGGKMEFTEEQLTTLATKLGEMLGIKPGEGGGETKPPEGGLKLDEIAEIKKLAEENPLVAGLVKHMESQGISLAEQSKQLREAQIEKQMSEFNNASKLVVTPTMQTAIREFLTELPMQLSEKFWNIMIAMRNSQAVMVELGERSGAAVRFGQDKAPSVQFSERVNALMASDKLSYVDAVERVAADDPSLWERYRQESFINS